MKNIKLFRVLAALLFIFVLFIFINEVHANTINSIIMDIYIDEQGNANITEIWDCNATQGTEVYHPYYNLGNSQIINLSVKDGGTKYLTLSSWSSSASFENKKNKCGIAIIPDGVELCWGISSYGKHKYEVSYTITNFVSELTDSQMAYWTLIPHNLSNTVGNVYIKIHSDFKYSSDWDVWGYGKYGAPCYIYDGYIEFTTDNKTLYSDEYMTILIKFPLDTFTLANKLPNDFQHYLDMAEEDATKFDYDGYYSSSLDGIFGFIGFMFTFGFMVVVAIAILASANGASILETGGIYKKLPKDVEYFRDLPYNGNIFLGYHTSQFYSLIKNKTDFLGAVLLKWLKEGTISIEKRTVGTIIKKQENCVVLNSSITTTNEEEKELYSFFKTAAKDDVLEPNEFKKWCSKNYEKMLNWFETVLIAQNRILEVDGKLEVEEVGSVFKRKRYIAKESLFEDGKQLKGLRNFLKDLTLINKREPIEVILFEEYLMYAQIFGIAKQVQKDFEKIYPNIIQEYNANYNYNNLAFVCAFAYMGTRSATSAKSAAEARASSYSGGGRWFFFWWWPVEVHLEAVAGGRWIPLINETIE